MRWCLSAVVVWLAAAPAQNSGGAPSKPRELGINLERMATCQDSWLDWKDDPVRATAYVDSIKAAFRESEGASFTPIAPTTAAGLPVTKMYPGSVGMGVGFSLAIAAPFDRTKTAFELVLGKPLRQCETSEGTRTCELQIADKKTFMMIADASPKSTSTLVGCFYFYEK